MDHPKRPLVKEVISLPPMITRGGPLMVFTTVASVVASLTLMTWQGSQCQRANQAHRPIVAPTDWNNPATTRQQLEVLTRESEPRLAIPSTGCGYVHPLSGDPKTLIARTCDDLQNDDTIELELRRRVEVERKRVSSHSSQCTLGSSAKAALSP
jgi:hypothetical protein